MNSHNPVDAQIGQRLQLRRLELAYSQDQLAATVGTTVANIQNWGAGQLHIEARELQQLADAMKVPLNLFLKSSTANTKSY